jgi:hypothetical protein
LPNRDQEEANFGSSPIGPAHGLAGYVEDRSSARRQADRSSRATAFVHDDRDDPFPTPSVNVPGFGTRTRDDTQNLAVGLNQSMSHRLFNELRVGWNRLARDVTPDNQGIDGYAALAMTGPVLPTRIAASLRSTSLASMLSATTCRCRSCGGPTRSTCPTC